LAAGQANDGKHFLPGTPLPVGTLRSFTRRNAVCDITLRIEVDDYFVYEISKNSIPFPTSFLTMHVQWIHVTHTHTYIYIKSENSMPMA
jgi:hypothetical protein